MRKRILCLTTALSVLSLSHQAYAQSSQELLLNLERKVKERAAQPAAVAEKAETQVAFKENIIIERDPVATTSLNVRSLESMKEPVQNKVDVDTSGTSPLLVDNELPHSELPLRELPTGTRFTFKKSLYFPANTNAKVYVDGAYKLKVYTGSYPADELFKHETGVHSACAVKSSKGYVKLMGSEESTTPSFIDFDEIIYVEESETSRYMFTMGFMEKNPAGLGSINVEITCLIPQSMNSDLPSLKLSYLYDALPGLFEVHTPQHVVL